MNITIEETIKQVKGNIKIDRNLLYKYDNVKELLIFELEKSKKNFNSKVIINKQLTELNEIEISEMTLTELKKKSIEIYKNNHNTNTFKNNNNDITINNKDIKESIKKIVGDKRQKEYLEEHLKVFSKLGNIIEYGTLISENIEQKSRQNYNSWHYYIENIILNKKRFLLEFDVVSRNDGENHYRLHRLIPLNNKNRSPNSSISIKTMGAASERSVSTKNIPQKNSKVNKK